MKNYKALLEKLDPADTVFSTVRRRAVILSGQSDFSHSELSKEQMRLLSLFNDLGYETTKTGFPFNKEHDFAGCKRSNLFKASLRNMLQFYYSITDEQYKKMLVRHLQPMCSGAEKILIVCQSSGLNMLKAALPYLTIEEGTNITVLALGPVAWGRFQDPRMNVVVIKGYWDVVSRLCDRQKVNFWVSCHHLNYCRLAKLPKIIRGAIKIED